MDIQAILPQINNAVNLSSNGIKCGDEFEKLLQQVSEETDIAEMKKFLDEKFNVNTVVVDYSCEKTDTEAEMYDTAMLEKYDMHGGRNVIISKKTLLRMKKDGAFRQKVYKSIEDIPWTSKLTGGEVKAMEYLSMKMEREVTIWSLIGGMMMKKQNQRKVRCCTLTVRV